MVYIILICFQVDPKEWKFIDYTIQNAKTKKDPLDQFLFKIKSRKRLPVIKIQCTNSEFLKKAFDFDISIIQLRKSKKKLSIDNWLKINIRKPDILQKYMFAARLFSSYSDLRDGTALQVFQELQKLALDKKDKEVVAICYNNLGQIYAVSGQYERALKNYRQALQYFETRNQPCSMATIFTNIAVIYENMGKLI